MLYPILFQPIIKPKVWGQEIWVLSGYGNDISVVQNGFLAGNTLNEILEIYMDELVGGNVYQMFDNLFPLLFKFIDADDDLSVQVHPDDGMAAEVEQLGKTEMWYVTRAQEQASILMGFARNTSREEVQQALDTDTIMDLLQRVPVHVGDTAFIAPGTVHALCRGTSVAEIQETSDMTYRLYDYRRPGLDGRLRELHIPQSLAALDYEALTEPLVSYDRRSNSAVSLAQDVHFYTNLLTFDKPIGRDYAALDSFVVYLCTQGQVRIDVLDGDIEPVTIAAGESVLIPASLNDIRLTPDTETKILETYVL